MCPAGKKGTARNVKIDPARVQALFDKHSGRRGELMAALDELQAEYGYLPRQALKLVADRSGISLVDLYGVVTFYKSFSLKPRGKNLIAICLGTACHVRTAPQIVAEFERRLGIPAGETTPDGEFTLETANCLGACALGPIVSVNGRFFSKVSIGRVKSIIAETSRGATPSRAATKDQGKRAAR